MVSNKFAKWFVLKHAKQSLEDIGETWDRRFLSWFRFDWRDPKIELKLQSRQKGSDNNPRHSMYEFF